MGGCQSQVVHTKVHSFSQLVTTVPTSVFQSWYKHICAVY